MTLSERTIAVSLQFCSTQHIHTFIFTILSDDPITLSWWWSLRSLIDWISTSRLIAMLRLLQLNPSLLRSITIVVSVPVISFIAIESVASVLIIDWWRIRGRRSTVVVVARLVTGRLVAGHPSCSVHWSLAALTATAGVVASGDNVSWEANGGRER
jgi:hypothetical protein